MSEPSPSRLTLFRRALHDPPMDAENPFFKRDGKAMRYASLRAVLGVIRPALDAAGLDLVQVVKTDGGKASLTTELLDGSTPLASSEYPLVFTGNAQQNGSELTYARRYALCTLCGIVGDPDDDGNEASIPPPAKRHAPPRREAADPDPDEQSEVAAIEYKGRKYHVHPDWNDQRNSGYVSAGKIAALSVEISKAIKATGIDRQAAAEAIRGVERKYQLKHWSLMPYRAFDTLLADLPRAIELAAPGSPEQSDHGDYS